MILIPTELERTILQPLLEPALRADDRVELCGFGLVAAAALTAQLIPRHRPNRVLLIGIAGTFCEEISVGSAIAFDQVACFGIGAGSGQEHQTAGDMGWHHVGGQVTETNVSGTIIADTLAIRGFHSADGIAPSAQLLSATAASANSDDAKIRRRRFPDAVAEDMEGFAVAMACRLAEVPVAIVRGISNQVGDRNVADWQIKPALKAAAALSRNVIAEQAVSDEGRRDA